MRLSGEEIEKYQAIIKSRFSGSLLESFDKGYKLTDQEIMCLPDEDKVLYREWMFIQRYQDIQQKIHFKTNYLQFQKASKDVDSRKTSDDMMEQVIFKHISECRKLEDHLNLKGELACLDLDVSARNFIISLHNKAHKDEYYGEGMMNSLIFLQEKGVLTQQDVTKLYILSLEWPHDI